MVNFDNIVVTVFIIALIGINFAMKKWSKDKKSLFIVIVDQLKSLNSNSTRNHKTIMSILFVIYIPIEGFRSAIAARNGSTEILDYLSFAFLATLEFVCITFAVWNIQKAFSMFKELGGKFTISASTIVSASILSILIILGYLRYIPYFGGMTILYILLLFLAVIKIPKKIIILHIAPFLFYAFFGLLCTSAFFIFALVTGKVMLVEIVNGNVSVSWDLSILVSNLNLLIQLFLISLSNFMAIGLTLSYDAGQNNLNKMYGITAYKPGKKTSVKTLMVLTGIPEADFKLADNNKNTDDVELWLMKMDTYRFQIKNALDKARSVLDPNYQLAYKKNQKLIKFIGTELKKINTTDTYVPKDITW